MKKIIILLIVTLSLFGSTEDTVCIQLKQTVTDRVDSLDRIDNDLYMLSVLSDLHNDMVTVVTQCPITQDEYKEYHLALNEVMETIVILKTITKQ